jgi:hypothetical protein
MNLRKRTLLAMQAKPHLKPLLLPLLSRTKESFFDDPYPDPEQMKPFLEMSKELHKMLKALNKRFQKVMEDQDTSSGEYLIKKIISVLTDAEKDAAKLAKTTVPDAQKALARARKARIPKTAMDFRGVIRVVFAPLAWAIRYLGGPINPVVYEEMDHLIGIVDKMRLALNKSIGEYFKVLKKVKGSFLLTNTPEEKKAIVRLEQMFSQLIAIRDTFTTLQPLMEQTQSRFEWGTALPDNITKSRKQEKALLEFEQQRDKDRKEITNAMRKELLKGVTKGIATGVSKTIGF